MTNLALLPQRSWRSVSVSDGRGDDIAYVDGLPTSALSTSIDITTASFAKQKGACE